MSVTAIDKMLQTRRGVIENFLRSEKKYIASLKVWNNFRVALYESGLLSTETMMALFSNIEEVICVSQFFLQDLKAESGKLDVAASFGSVFLEYAKHFDVNACYASNYVTAEEILHFLIEHCKPFQQMVENICKTNILDIISMVHQRGPKYEFVIKGLMKFTPPEFEDRDALGEALVSMKATSALINSCIMEAQKDVVMEAQKEVKMKVHKNVVPRVRVCSSRQLCLDKKTFFENKKVNDFGYNVLGYAKLSRDQRSILHKWLESDSDSEFDVVLDPHSDSEFDV